jgi:hypothetical protein
MRVTAPVFACLLVNPALPAQSFIVEWCAGKCGKKGVINDWLNERFGSTGEDQILQCSGLFVDQTSHIILNCVRQLLQYCRLIWTCKNCLKADVSFCWPCQIVYFTNTGPIFF